MNPDQCASEDHQPNSGWLYFLCLLSVLFPLLYLFYSISSISSTEYILIDLRLTASG